MGLINSHKGKPVAMLTSNILHAHLKSKCFYDCQQFDFNYKSAIGKLNYLAQSSRPDIIYAIHMLARWSSDPRLEHGEAVLYLCMYLNKTRGLGLKFKPDTAKGFECYANANFVGYWLKYTADVDPATAKSRSGRYMFYAGVPIIWASKLQTQIALSTTEAEYIALSCALRDVIPIMQVVNEVKKRGFRLSALLPLSTAKRLRIMQGP